MWKHRTNKGRVVYDRKLNLFECRDVERITRRVGCSVLYIPFDLWTNYVEFFEYHTSRWIDAQERDDIYIEFGGGSFGGGGASRDFGEPSEEGDSEESFGEHGIFSIIRGK